MHIGVIGGHTRQKAQLRLRASAAGHDVEFHSGRTSGPSTCGLRTLVDRCDVVVVITEINSHGAVGLARRWMKAKGSSPRYLRRFGLSQLDAIMSNRTAEDSDTSS